MENKYQIPSGSCDEIEQQNFWSKVVDDQIASGMGAERFCQHHQINFSTFHYRKYKKAKANCLLSKNVIRPKDKQHNKNVAKFISLQVAADVPSNESHKEGAADIQNEKVEIAFKNGHKIILPLVISEANLLLLIKTIGELRC